MKLSDLSVVAANKASGVAFLDAAAGIWADRKTLLVSDVPVPGLTAAETLHLEPSGGWWQGRFDTDFSESIAQISVTSGTTGTPKAIAISRRAISDTVVRLGRSMEMNASVREYIAVPVTYSFGLARARAVAAAGGLAFLPANGFRPDEIASLLQRGEINALSAVPTMLRTVLANPSLLDGVGHKLRWLEIGSQYMAASEKRAVRELFPEAVILQHYGLTEASRSTFLRIDLANEAELESVGHAVEDGDVRIGAGGVIEIRGPHVASGIVSGKAIVPLANDEGWLTTTDLGELRGKWLRYKGRADDVANIGGIKVSAEVVEKMIRERLPAGVDFAVCIIRDALRGERLAVVFAGTAHASYRASIREAAEANGLKQLDIAEYEVAKLPRTETGKVMRGSLAAMIEARAPSAPAPQSALGEAALSPREAEIASIWSDALGVSAVGRHDSFYDLGGDSLSAVAVVIKAEQAGLPADILQGMFAGQTVSQIAASLDGERMSSDVRGVQSVRADALNAVRGLLALLIVASHWGPFLFERAGEAGRIAWSAVAPILRIGTPGFAMIYGMGLGLFFLGQLGRDDVQLRRRTRRNALMLFAGVLLVGGAEAWRLAASGEGFGPIWPEQLFYEVLLFYLVMVLTSLFWLRRIAAAKDPLFASFLLALVAYGAYALCVWLMPVNRTTGWASLGWHMLVAPYAYPRLLGAAALGLAASIWLRRETEVRRIVEGTSKAGMILGGLGFLLVASIDGGWRAHAGDLIAVPAFAGASLLLYAAAATLAARPHKPVLLRLAIVCGMLAFPIFIGHGIVIPAKIALEASGWPAAPAIALPATLFLAAMVWFGSRIYRMMFAKPPAKA